MAKQSLIEPKREVVKIHVKFTLNTPDGLRRVVFDLEKDTDEKGGIDWKITFQLFERIFSEPFRQRIPDPIRRKAVIRQIDESADAALQSLTRFFLRTTAGVSA